MELKFTVKNHYGQTRIYPTCETGKVLLSLTRHASFTKKEINKLRSIGYTCTVVDRPTDL